MVSRNSPASNICVCISVYWSLCSRVPSLRSVIQWNTMKQKLLLSEPAIEPKHLRLILTRKDFRVKAGETLARVRACVRACAVSSDLTSPTLFFLFSSSMPFPWLIQRDTLSEVQYSALTYSKATYGALLIVYVLPCHLITFSTSRIPPWGPWYSSHDHRQTGNP